MNTNLHTHTVRCGHASGTEEEYITAAIRAGMTTLGFSDHTPYFFEGSYHSNLRMRPELLGGYVTALMELRKDYAHQIELHIGVEAEYYPKTFAKTLDFLKEHGIEYMLLGQHFIGDEPTGFYSGSATSDEKILEQYVRQTVEAMETGLFTYLAHPDLIRFTGSNVAYRRWMRVLVQEAKNCSLPLEFNFLGYSEGRHYPNRNFWELVAEENMSAVLGCDAHSPQALLDGKTEERARTYLKGMGIPVLEKVEIRKLIV